MKSFRNPKYLEREEDVIFELETPLNTSNPGNNQSQKKDGFRFVIENSGEVTPFDWFNSRISVGFKVQNMDNTDIALEDHYGIVNVSHSLINNGPFAASGHMVQNPPCWRASYALGHPKQRKCKFVLMKSLCSGCPSGQLPLQHGGFCTM